jgi:hypothetical protein
LPIGSPEPVGEVKGSQLLSRSADDDVTVEHPRQLIDDRF